MSSANELNGSQWASFGLILVSIASGITLLIVIYRKILPSTKAKNISVRNPHFMKLFLFIAAWLLLVVIPVTSSLVCFASNTTLDCVAGILFTSSMIPLLVVHLIRFALLRIQHGISNATLDFNLGHVTWTEYLDNWEIVLQEDFHISSTQKWTPYAIGLCAVLAIACAPILIFTSPLHYIWLTLAFLCLTCACTTAIVWLKSRYFSIDSKLDYYAILKEMHVTAIMLWAMCAAYAVATIASSASANVIAGSSDGETCRTTVVSLFVLVIGLSAIWSAQLRFALRAFSMTDRSIPLAQLLSSYEGYKCFLRFLVSEFSVENLEFFQLSMRWRYRICCWLYGLENSDKPPAQDIKLPFKIITFQYVDRLLPRHDGGGLVAADTASNIKRNPVGKMQKLALEEKDSEKYFTTLPISRNASINSNASHWTSPNLNDMVGPFGGPGILALGGGIPRPATIKEDHMAELDEQDDHHEQDMDYTREFTNTATFVLPPTIPPQTLDDDHDAVLGVLQEHRHSGLLEHLSALNKGPRSSMKLQKTPPAITRPPSVINSPMMQSRQYSQEKTHDPPGSGETTPLDHGGELHYMLRKIPHEHEIIEGIEDHEQDPCADEAKHVPIIAGTSRTTDLDDPDTKLRAVLVGTQDTNASDFSTEEEDGDTSTPVWRPIQPTHSLRLPIKSNNSNANNNTNNNNNMQSLTDAALHDDIADAESLATTPEPMSVAITSATTGNLEHGLSSHSKPAPLPDRTSTQRLETLVSKFGSIGESDEDEAGMQYVEYDTDRTGVDSHKSTKPLSMHMHVRFAVESADADDAKTDHQRKKGRGALTMADILGGHGGVRVAELNPMTTSTTAMQRQQSEQSKAEPSWFAAWFRKGSVGGEQRERADELMQYSDLSWRRMKKVSKEVNMSHVARDNIKTLFRKYPKGRYLERNGITLEEYDVHMRDAWCAAWENMGDSLRRFGRSEFFSKYLAKADHLTIRKLENADSDPLHQMEQAALSAQTKQNVNNTHVNESLESPPRGEMRKDTVDEVVEDVLADTTIDLDRYVSTVQSTKL